MGVRAQRLKFWPFHIRKLKPVLFRRYEIGGEQYILVGCAVGEKGSYMLQFMPYELWEESLRL